MKSPSNQSSRPQSMGVYPFVLGLFLFGTTLGAIAGASVAAGISQALLTALFSFVGGVLLSYGGFRYRRSGSADAPTPDVEIDVGRVGAGLSALSLGLALGIAGGYAAKSAQRESQMDRDEARYLATLERRLNFAKLHGLEFKSMAPVAEKPSRALSILESATQPSSTELDSALRRLHTNVSAGSMKHHVEELASAAGLTQPCEEKEDTAPCKTLRILTKEVSACEGVWDAYRRQHDTTENQDTK